MYNFTAKEKHHAMKRSFLILSLLCISMSHALSAPPPERDNSRADSIRGIYIPRNLDECMSELDRLISDSGKLDMIARGALSQHFGAGIWIRNNWGLWGGSRLSGYMKSKGAVAGDPDGMSSSILALYVEHLKGRDERWQWIDTPEGTMEPVFLIDGKRVDKEKVTRKTRRRKPLYFGPDNIITPETDSTIIAKYGKQALNGVIHIETR